MSSHRVWLLNDILLDIVMVFICLCNNHVMLMYLCLNYVFVPFTVAITCESCVIACLVSTRACLAHHMKVRASWEEFVNQTYHNSISMSILSCCWDIEIHMLIMLWRWSSNISDFSMIYMWFFLSYSFIDKCFCS